MTDRLGQTEKIAVLTDSCADLPVEWTDRFHIFVLPLIIRCKNQEFHDGVDIFPEDIYEVLKTELPKTSTPSGDDIEEVFDQIKAEGYNKVIAVMLSSGLSGTVNHVRLAAEDREDLEIAVFDSKSGSIGIGITAVMAAEYAQKGMSFEEIKARMPKLIDQTFIFFSIDTLEYLEKGGRIGKATALAGNLLNLKPILTVENQKEGEIATAALARGAKSVPKKLLSLIADHYEEGRPYNLMIADGNMPEERDKLEKKITALYPDYHYFVKMNIGATLSSYIGPGILGAAIQYID